ncbi:MAG: hypothetical protein JWR81_3370, partial [Pseudonocardia sp.]|nr:hypothetical protein [Pseudonocardia sp.]
MLDLLGVAVFAASGALAAVHARLDVFGVTVLAGVTALGGGVVRVVLLRITPAHHAAPAAVPGRPAGGGAAGAPAVARPRRGGQLADAPGLALFVTTGTTLALKAGAPAVTAGLVAVLTGVGGGVLRDVLLNEIPTVLRRDIYAIAPSAVPPWWWRPTGSGFLRCRSRWSLRCSWPACACPPVPRALIKAGMSSDDRRERQRRLDQRG